MQQGRTKRRSILLALSLLSACAASTAGRPGLSGGALRHPVPAPAGTSGDFLVGRMAGQMGDIQVAADAFLRALRRDPGNQDVREQAFLACLLAGRPDARTLAQSLPGNPAAMLLLTDAAALAGDWPRAEALAAALPARGVTQVLRPLLIAWAQFGGGHADAALETLRPLDSGPQAGGIYALHAAMIADLSQRDPEAGRLYRAAQAAFAEPNLQLNRALASWQARQPDGGAKQAAATTLAAMVAASPDLAITLPSLRRAVAERPVHLATDGIAEAYLAEASALQLHNAPEYAALLLRLALDLRPDLTAARLLWAEISERSKHPATALALLQPVSDADPLAALVALRRALLLDQLDRDREALAILGRMQASYPERPEPWSLQGAILRRQKQFAEAAAAYDQAIARIPSPTDADWLLFYQRGISLDQAHRWPQAEADFKRALALHPDQPNVLNYLAYSWTERHQNLPLARQMIQRAVAQQPNDPAMIDSFGWIMLRQGDVPGAVQQLEHASELDPEDATINNHLGDAYRAAGDKLDALFQWRRALTLHPDRTEASELEAKLKQAGAPSAPPMLKSSTQP